MKKTKIVATLGPASSSAEVIEELVKATAVSENAKENEEDELELASVLDSFFGSASCLGQK